MARSFVYVVTDSPELLEKLKKSSEGHEVSYLNYSAQQWRDGLENPFFRSQLVNGLPALSLGGAPAPTSAPQESVNNVVSFPSSVNGAGGKIQTMHDLEAKAIESAIFQYKGNLTEAAKALGIGRATLYRKVKHYQIDPTQARRRKLAA